MFKNVRKQFENWTVGQKEWKELGENIFGINGFHINGK